MFDCADYPSISEGVNDRAMIKQVFHNTNLEMIDDGENPDIEFLRFEFMESLVRLAKLRDGRMSSSEALGTLLETMIVPEMVKKMDIPSHDMLRNRAVQCFLYESRDSLLKIYKRYVQTRSHGFKGCDINGR